jgi:hypothetical protein
MKQIILLLLVLLFIFSSNFVSAALGKFIASSISEDNLWNVGIGSAIQPQDLRVYGDITAENIFDSSGNSLWGKFQDAIGAGDIYYTDGNVGIGTNNPLTQL